MGNADAVIHRLFLIRHGETVDNVARLYGGVRDAALTSHGHQQTLRLGDYFAEQKVHFTHLFSSDLSRAFKTAEAIRASQPASDDGILSVHPLHVVALKHLREQDFGSLEGKPFDARPSGRGKVETDDHNRRHEQEPGFQEIESKEAMSKRANAFIDEHLFPVLNNTTPTRESCVGIVSHGMLLSTLWRCILRRQSPSTVSLDPKISQAVRISSLEHLGGWGNTAYLELELVQRQPAFKTLRDIADGNEMKSVLAKLPIVSGKIEHDSISETISTDASTQSMPLGAETSSQFSIRIKVVNSRDHLKGLKRTGGGVGSSKFDGSQKGIESFFKRRKPS